jgi:hypothetical protein
MIRDMKAELRKLAHATPFVPFTIHLADGGFLRVPTGDHIAVPPGGGRVFVFGEGERYEVVSALLITRISIEREAASSNQAE